MGYIFSDSGSGGKKAVRIKASLLSYRFIEHCLHKDPRAIPPEDNSTAVLLAENCVTSTIENVWLEASTGNGQAIKEVRRDEVRFDDDFVDYNHIRVWVAGTSINAGAACRITPGPRKFNTIYEFLGFSHEEAAGFHKWYSRRVKPYCRDNGLNSDDYPISPSLLLEISRLKNTDIEGVITYFEHYCKTYNGHVSIELVESVAESFMVKSSTLDPAIVAAIVAEFPTKLAEYKAGKTNLLNLFFGEYIKRLSDKNIDKGKLRSDLADYL